MPGPLGGGRARGWPQRAGLAAGLALCCAFLLSSCASRPEFGALTATDAPADGAHDRAILVATTRARDPHPGTLFNGERADRIDHAAVVVSVPPAHADGQIEWPSTPPGDPRANFVVRDAHYIEDGAGFVAELNRQLALRPPGQRKTLVFVHGYNTKFAEAVYRVAQIAHDSQFPGVPILFTWASRGEPREYVYDNNSATAARDALERTLRAVAASNTEEVDVIAHSMGNWVAMEAFRQIVVSGKLPPHAKLGRIVLAAPDIDIDVFKSQMRRIGKPPKPFIVVVSQDDRALGLSKFLAGDKDRLGDGANAAELTKLGAIVVDLTNLKGDDPSNHGKFAQLAHLAPKLSEALRKGNAGQPSNEPDSLANSIVKIIGAPVSVLTPN